MNNEMMIPDVKQVVGRVINSIGEPLDGKGSISGGGSQALISLGESGAAQVEPRFWETGIKVVDLLAPLAWGGTFIVSGEAWTGKMVVIEELTQSFVSRHNGYVIALSMEENGYDASSLMEMFQELQQVHETYREKFTLVFEPLTASVETSQRMIQAALTLAKQLRTTGQQVMLLVDKQIVNRLKPDEMDALKRFIAAQGLVMLLIRLEGEADQGIEIQVAGRLDGQIVTSRELAKQKLWPAVDRLLSTTKLLESTHVSAEHKQVAEQLRQLLRTPSLSTEEQERMQRVQNFLTQPFFVAELYTGQPGEYVPLEQSIAQVKALLEGQYANIPSQAFYMVGTIEQAVAKNVPGK